MEKKLETLYKKSIKIPEGFENQVMDKIYARQIEKSSPVASYHFRWIFATSLLSVLIIFLFFFLMRPANNFYQKIVYTGTKTDTVFISGDFNQWKPEKMHYDGKQWIIEINVKPQVLYQYVFVVNGEVQKADTDSLVTQDYFGQPNSTLLVLQ